MNSLNTVHTVPTRIIRNGILESHNTVFDTVEVTAEEKEILKEYVKKEMELKRMKEKQKAEAEQCLKEEPFLESYFVPYKDLSGSAYSNVTCWGQPPPWSVTQKTIQPDKILAAYIEIQSWKEFCVNTIPGRVQTIMNRDFWNKSDSELYQEYIEFMKNPHRTCDWWQERGSLRRMDVYCRSFPDIPPLTNVDGTAKDDGWKYTVFKTLFESELSTQYKQWRTYVQMYIKRHENVSTEKLPRELETKIQSLESELKTTKEQLSEAYSKLKTLKTVCYEVFKDSHL